MSVAGRTAVDCQRCGTSLAELGWAACLSCLYAGVDTRPRIAGFELGAVLGRGGMGVVYRARQVRLDRTVAIKVLDADLACDAAFRARFAREARLLARLAHPNIVAIYEAGETDESCYVVMELVEGGPIDVCEPARALQLVAQLCGALAAAHRAGIVHRDIKPSNVLVCGDQVKLVDFGIAALLDATNALTMQGQQFGTPAFMAPEAWGDAPAQPAMDVYGAALLLRSITRGHRLPRGVEAIVETALSADPQRRPAIEELRRALAPSAKRRARRVASACVVLAAVALVPRIELETADAAGPQERVEQPIAADAEAPPVMITASDTPPPIAPRRSARAKKRAPPPPPPPAPAFATLAIRATPWALVSIDGATAIRAEPPLEAITIAAGRHVVELSNPVAERRERLVVDVAPSETRTLTVSLERKP